MAAASFARAAALLLSALAAAGFRVRSEPRASAVFEDSIWAGTSAEGRAALARSERTFTSKVHTGKLWEASDLELQVELDGAARAEALLELMPVRRRLSNIEAINAAAKRQILVNYGDVQYVTHFRMGRQTIVGILDTGSFELVVFSKVCKSCGTAAKYDPKTSPNHLSGKLMTMQSYGSGDTYSSQAYDLLSIGPYSEMNQTFWEVVGARMPILTTSAFEAIIGIGPPETPGVDAWLDAQDAINNISAVYTEGMRPPTSALKHAKESIEAAMEVSRNPTMVDNFGVGSFSLCLGTVPGADGYLIWNDTSAFDRPEIFKRVPVVGKHTWSVGLSNVGLSFPKEVSSGSSGPEPFACNEGCVALMDSGTSLLAVPGSVISWLSKKMDLLNPDCSNIDELPDLVFTLGNETFSLPPDAYVAEVKGNVPKYLQSFVRVRNVQATTSSKTQCQLLLMESYAEGNLGPFWILGMPFFRKYYTTFFIGDSTDSRALYIAPSSDDCTPTVEAEAALSRSKPYKRLIDPNKVHVSHAVQKARSQKSIAL